MGDSRSIANILASANKKITPIAKAWNQASELFKHDKTEQAIDNAINEANMQTAMKIFILGGFIVFAISLATSYESILVAQFQADTINELGQQMILPTVDWPRLVAYQFILYVAIGTIISLAFEWLAYIAAKALGGKGTMAQQFHIAAVITLAISFAAIISILAPLPCIQFIALLGWIAILVYFSVYITAKAYVKVHSISFLRASVIAIVAFILRNALLFLVTNALLEFMGLKPF